MENYFMKIAIKEARKAFKRKDIPVGAVLVRNNKIIAKAYNKKNNKNVATYHAEIIVIEKASKKMRDWRLSDCSLYVTLEPCDMCYKAMMEARIKEVIYLKNSNYNLSINKLIKTKFDNNDFENDYSNMLIKAFKNIRYKK